MSGEPGQPAYKRIRKIEAYLRNKSREKGWHSDEKKHKRGEWSHWRIQNATAILSLLFSVIAAVTAVYGASIAIKAFEEARRQANEAKRQADVAVSDQRPWLHIEDIKTEPINYTVNGLLFTVRFTVKNFGRSPAIHAYARPKLIPLKYDASAEVQSLCDTYDFQNKSGPLVFMSEPQEFPVTLTITNDEIAQLRKFFEAQGSKMVSAWMTLLVCVQYNSLYDVQPHHEGRAYNLNPIDITNATVGGVLSAPNGHPSFLIPNFLD